MLEFSPDNGVTWQERAPSVPAASGQYTWTVPPVPATAQARSSPGKRADGGTF